MPTDLRITRKLIAFSADAWYALDRLSEDRMKSIQELTDEVFRDLLKKHGRPVTLRDMLRQSARHQPW